MRIINISGNFGRRSIAKMIKPNLKQTLRKVDRLPNKIFGKIDVDRSTLPCLKKVSREKITANFD